MPLLAPRVIGPLSECSSSIRVQGQVTGATVDIFSNGTHVAGGIATYFDQTFSLSPGVSLTAGANITATQTMGTDVSPPSQEAVQVQARPTFVGYVGFKSHLYVCGQCLWLDGLLPGANVEVRVGGVVRGSGTAPDGNARIFLSSPILAGEILEAQQTACGITGLLTPGPIPDNLPIKHG